jgi:hypothetical protein
MSQRSGTEHLFLALQAWRRAALMLRRRVQKRDVLFSDLLARRDRWSEEARRIRTWAARWKAVAHRHRSHVRGLTMRFIRNLTGRVRAEREVERLQKALDSSNACCNRIQADGNALADQLHAWRQACQDHGIQPTPEALRAVLRRVDAACVAEADL